MKDEKQAGALAARNIAVLEQAHSVLMDVQIDLWTAMDRVGNDVITAHNWAGHFDWDEGQWFALHESRLSDVGDKYLGTFSLERSGDEDQFWLSTLCGTGKDEAALKFTVSHGELTSKGAWKKFASDAHSRRSDLKGMGFQYEESEGSWYLPFRLDPNLVADAYANDDYEAALQPFRAALATVATAIPLFTNILADAKKRFPPTG